MFIWICIIIFITFSKPSFAESKYVIDKQKSSIRCSIKYTLVGRYQALLEDFSGSIYFDPKKIENSSVKMVIKTISLKSKHSTLDRIVLSKRLLDAEQYPEITFRSNSIKQKGEDYEVTGMLNLHGISQIITFPFKLEGPITEIDKPQYIKARGAWHIDRKKFDIIWSRVLDYGGIIVGNRIIVDWEVVAFK